MGTAILLATLAPMFMGGSNVASGSDQVIGTGDWATVVVPSVPVPGSPVAKAATQAVPAGQLVDGITFEIQIQSIGYRAVVRQGVGLSILALGPGHYPGTPWPGEPGNVGVAAHNVYWMSFNRLRVGDRVEIRTQHAVYVYQLSGSAVVSPNDRTVLAATTDRRLTLTTCYPLWAGALATQRLIFTAHEIGGVS